MASQHTLSSMSIDGVPVKEPKAPKLAIQGMSLTIGTRIILDDIFIDIPAGKIVGLLGPNGSGKTSLMKCLTGLIRPDRGTVWLDGSSISSTDRSLRATMGVVFQEPSLDNHLRASENLELGARLFGLSRKEARTRAEELLHFVELSDRANDLTKTFSGGMRRRLELARALIHKPTVLLLDEPTSGLDLVAYERVWQRLEALRQNNELTVLVSTHRADEAARCDQLVLLNRGHVIADESPDRLMQRVGNDIIQMEVADAEAIVEEIDAELETPSRIMDETHLEVEFQDAHQRLPRLVEAFPPGTFHSIGVRRPSLADAFFHLTGHSLNQEVEND